MSLWLAICLGTCMSSGAATLEQRDAADLLSMLEYLGAIEDESAWSEFLGTLGSGKTSTDDATANPVPTSENVETVTEIPVDATQPGLELVEAMPAGKKTATLCADVESC